MVGNACGHMTEKGVLTLIVTGAGFDSGTPGAEKTVGPSPLSLNIPEEDTGVLRRTVVPLCHPDDSRHEELSPLPFSHTTLCSLMGSYPGRVCGLSTYKVLTFM